MMKKVAIYIIALLLSTSLLFFTVGSIVGVENIYNSFMLTLLTMHFILSYIFLQLNK